MTVTPSATPVLVVSNGLQTITLSANATPTINGIAAGQNVTFRFANRRPAALSPGPGPLQSTAESQSGPVLQPARNSLLRALADRT
jgi:hypothetical protein